MSRNRPLADYTVCRTFCHGFKPRSGAAAQVYDEPTVLVCYRVTGEEEVPEGVVGVLTPDAPDVLSHLSVRARNMKVNAIRCIAGRVTNTRLLSKFIGSKP